MECLKREKESMSLAGYSPFERSENVENKDLFSGFASPYQA
jgi:hypothetical protein